MKYLFWFCISVNFKKKVKSIIIIGQQNEDWVIFATQVSAKAKNRAKFKTKKNKEAKKVKSDSKEVQIIENGSRDAEENTERKRGP